MAKRVNFLVTPHQHSQGARGKSSLGDEILAFLYPVPARRLYFTFSCPPLRIVAIDPQLSSVLFDDVVKPNQFVLLPKTRLVLEMDPGVEYAEVLPGILAGMDTKTCRVMGGVNQQVNAQHLLFALFADALADLRRVKTVCITAEGVDPDALKSKFLPWERGKIVGSAGFVIDYKRVVDWKIPTGAHGLAAQIMQIESNYHDELLAASVAGIPWKHSISSNCIRCGRPASWRFALPIPQGMPVELSWRLQRPENAVPLCRVCVDTQRFCNLKSTLPDLVANLWGPRFAALKRWYLAVQNLDGFSLPRDWNKENYPLWPKEFGGGEWATGSGAAVHADPMGPEHIRRTPKQERQLTTAYGVRFGLSV